MTCDDNHAFESVCWPRLIDNNPITLITVICPTIDFMVASLTSPWGTCLHSTICKWSSTMVIYYYCGLFSKRIKIKVRLHNLTAWKWPNPHCYKDVHWTCRIVSNWRAWARSRSIPNLFNMSRKCILKQVNNHSQTFKLDIENLNDE